MPRINLLPWREELRKERQKNFGVAAVAAVVLGAGVVWYSNATLERFIEHQKERNNMLQVQINALDKQIEAIQDLEQTKDRLIARMQIIEELQRSRPEIVHLFDEVVRTLPEGVQLRSVKQTGDRISIKGVAQSSTRVSAYMRNIDASDWLTDPGLDVVETVDQGRDRMSEFTIFARQVQKKAEGDDKAKAGSS